MPKLDSKSDSVHSTKTLLSAFSSSPNVKRDYCFSCLCVQSFVCSLSKAEAGLSNDAQHISVLAALSVACVKVSILTGLGFQKNPVIVNELVVSRCLLLSFKSNQN